MVEGNDMGRYGAISFLRAREPDKVIASYPIDTEVTTIGRDPSCDIRLYYPEVSALHAKLIIEDRKVCPLF
jgi:pSer/pThr/pTyr-binding forkhead associated (FHA) protein